MLVNSKQAVSSYIYLSVITTFYLVTENTMTYYCSLSIGIRDLQGPKQRSRPDS